MSYLDEYGVADARREKLQKRSLLTLLTVLVVGGVLYLWFKNYTEESRVNQFLAQLERGDYPAAYTFWGCRVESPCPNYDYQNFLEDWGPKSPLGKLRSHRLGRSREKGSGVEIPLVLNDQPEVRLWVEKKDGVLGFSPF